MGVSTQSTWEFKSENLRENNQAKPQTKEEKMALNINTFSPFSMRSAFDNSFFSNRWNDDWMVPSKNLDSQFKEFSSLFNKEEAKVEEDNTRMEVSIDASEYKPEELKVSVQSGRLLVKEGTRRRRRTVAATSRGASQGGTPCPRRRKPTRWFPISPLRESLSSPHPRVPLLLQMRPMKQSEILSFI